MPLRGRLPLLADDEAGDIYQPLAVTSQLQAGGEGVLCAGDAAVEVEAPQRLGVDA